MKKNITSGLLLFSIISVFTACGGEKDIKEELSRLKGERSEINEQIDSLEKELFGTTNDIPLISVDTLGKSNFQNSIEIQGSVEAEKNVLLNCETPGLIKRILVEEGQRVSAGQTLMILDAEMIAKNIDEVEKSLELAVFVYEKQESLHKQNIGSELQFQQAKNNKERLEETLKTLKTQQSKSVVSAPFSGYVEQIFYKEGEMAMPQMPMIRLLDLSKVKIIANVMETYLTSIKSDTKVDVIIAALNDTVIENVSLSRIGKYINPANRTFEIEAKLDNKNERILPNLVTAVKVKNEIINNAFTVPSVSIMQSSSGQDFIFIAVKNNNKTDKLNKSKKKKWMFLDITNDYTYKVEKVIIDRGPTNKTTQRTVVFPFDGSTALTPGTLVIVDGARGVKSGMEVQIKK